MVSASTRTTRPRTRFRRARSPGWSRSRRAASCTFLSKAQRAQAAGAVGLILADNRFGEANAIPLQLPIPAAMIADLDGQQLRAYLAQKGGRTIISAGRGPTEIVTGRSGIVTSFSSAAPTNFGHSLKPDVAAPGGQILSSTSPESAGSGSPFAVFDGTSMSAPHVAGAAALLLQAHPTWTPRQTRSAFVSTAGPAWGNTARTQEAPVVLQGGGLIDVVRADQPYLFTSPVSLSFGDIDVNRGPQTRALATQLDDAGGGAGTWSVELLPQAASAGATVEPDPQVTIPPGGSDRLGVTVRARADAAAGDNFGFVVLRRGDITRRIPYYFAVTRPGLELRPAAPLREFNTGDTRDGVSHASTYRFPSWPFGPPADYPSGAPMIQDGAEDLYTALIDEPVVNFGAAVWLSGGGALIDPWILGSPDENDVQGQGATPVNVNNFTFGYRIDVGAAGLTFPRPKRYWISVDSGRDSFTGVPQHGPYVLKAWQNDVYPPLVAIVSARVTAGHPLVIARILDYPASGRDSGIDPTSLVISYRRALVGASAYDPLTGYAIFGLPTNAPRIPVGRTNAMILAADFQEAKNVSTPGGSILPNTTVANVRLTGVAGPTVTWLDPERTQCVNNRRQRLLVAADSDKRLRTLTFFDGNKRIARVAGTASPLYESNWTTRGAKRGRHTLTVVVRDARRPRGPRDPRRSRLPLAVVTGASSGIGAALARRLASDGWSLVLLARREDRLRELAEELGAEYEVCDVSSREDVDRVAASVLERHPKLNLLVNNAGVPGRRDFLGADPETIERVIDTNYLGSVWSLRAFLPGLEAAAPEAHVANIVSVAGTVAFPPSGPYSASKHAQLAFSRATTRQLGGRGIKVLTVLPGFIETEGFPQKTALQSRFFRGQVKTPEQLVDKIVGAIASGRKQLTYPAFYRVFGILQAARAVAPRAHRRLRLPQGLAPEQVPTRLDPVGVGRRERPRLLAGLALAAGQVEVGLDLALVRVDA